MAKIKGWWQLKYNITLNGDFSTKQTRYPINFTCTYNDVTQKCSGFMTVKSSNAGNCWYILLDSPTSGSDMIYMYDGRVNRDRIPGNFYFGEIEQDLDDEIYSLFTANATQVFYEVSSGGSTTATASVTYNGNEIASIESGQTATLSCAGKKMKSDIVITL